MEETTTQPAPASNKKMLYIGIAVVALLLIGGAVFGHSSIVAPGITVDRNMDGSATYNSEQGSATVGKNVKMPDNWPSDAPQPYMSATLLYSGATNPTTGQPGTAIAYNVNASMDTVLAYYKSQLASSGWKVEGDVNTAGMHVLSAKKDTRTFGVYMGDAGNGTTNVTVGIQI